MQYCDACQYRKLHQIPVPSIPLKTTQPFQVLHSDVWGPAPLLSVDGYSYYISFVDDFTRYVWLFPLHQKSEAIAVFLHFNKLVERQFQTQIKCLQIDRRGEYRKLQSLFHDLGILFRHPCPHTHQQQGRAKRKHQSIVEIGLTLLAKAAMDLKFWWEAFLSPVYLLNRLPTPVLKGLSHFESLF